MKIQKFEYLENEELFRWYKKHFSQFLKGYHLLKKKKDKKQRIIIIRVVLFRARIIMTYSCPAIRFSQIMFEFCLTNLFYLPPCIVSGKSLERILKSRNNILWSKILVKTPKMGSLFQKNAQIKTPKFRKIYCPLTLL